MKSADTGKSPTKHKDKTSMFLNRVQWMTTGLIPIFICMAAYNQLGHYVSSTRPAVYGTISDVTLDQGKHHVTNASVTFIAADKTTCFVKTWFRGTDSGIVDGATIKVVPAISRCSTPWFPDHIPPTEEELWIAVGSAAVAAAIIWFRRIGSSSSEKSSISD